MWRFGEVPYAAVAQLAIWKMGGISVATALQERSREIEFVANDAEAVVILSQADQVDQVQKALPNLKTVKTVISVPESQDESLVAPGTSVGKLVPGYEYKLIDDDGSTVKNGDTGRMAVRGITGILYWNNLHPQMPAKQAEDVKMGWSWLDDAYIQDPAFR